jgi:putative aminopeptidase
MKSEAEIRHPLDECFPDDARRDAADTRSTAAGNSHEAVALRRAPGTRSIASPNRTAGCRPHPPAAAESDGLERFVARISIRQRNGGVANREMMRFLPILALVFSLLCLRPAAAQTTPQPKAPGDLVGDLKEFVETPSVSGYENQLSEKIRAKLAALHPVVDNLGDVIVTIGGGAPHRLIVTPIDEPGFVVSGITPDGYLRLQRLPQGGDLPPIFNELYSAQPVKVRAASGKWIDGVVAGISVHLHRAGETTPSARDIENMYVDIGATSAAEAHKAGVDVLSPVAINRRFGDLAGQEIAGTSVGDKFGSVALINVLTHLEATKLKGTLTAAFVTQGRVGGRGLDRILRTTQADEMIYVGRMMPGGNVPGMQGVHRAPRREPGSGVLVGLDKSSGELSGPAAELKQLADANKIPLATDYSADIAPAGYLPPPAFPARWTHIGIAAAWRDTPAETIDKQDLSSLERLLDGAIEGPRPVVSKSEEHWKTASDYPSGSGSSIAYSLPRLVQAYGTSHHEGGVRVAVTDMLPGWAKPETDAAGNLILHLGAAPAGEQVPRVCVVAHMDEIGFEVKSIAEDGKLVVETLGGMDLSFYEGHPVLVHTTSDDHDGIMELPNGWDEQNFKWPSESDQTIRVDVGARNAKEVADLDIKVGDSITIPKEYRPLLGTRANGRSFDDRVGDTALISAVWALGGPLKGRDVTFVWSTGEELGLVGAGALAQRLAAEGHAPDYVFAVDTLVSSDSPLESKRFGDAEIGKGFAIRAVDNSNIAPRDLVAKLEKLARANQIPYQLGVTGGGNDGAQFVPFGSVDIALGWPLRYSHSPAEVIDTRDVDSLARIIAVIARSW